MRSSKVARRDNIDLMFMYTYTLVSLVTHLCHPPKMLLLPVFPVRRRSLTPFSPGLRKLLPRQTQAGDDEATEEDGEDDDDCLPSLAHQHHLTLTTWLLCTTRQWRQVLAEGPVTDSTNCDCCRPATWSASLYIHVVILVSYVCLLDLSFRVGRPSRPPLP